MNLLTKEFRQNIADEFIKTLEDSKKNNIPLWKTPWFTGNRPQNGNTKKPYKGINAAYLRYIQNKRGYIDPRWFTFNQIKKNNWHLRKDSQSVTVEYWFNEPYTFVKKGEDGEDDKVIKRDSLRARYYKVYNAEDIDGVPKWEQHINELVNPDLIIDKLSQSMNVKILEDQVDRAYYDCLIDEVHLPNRKYFKTSQDYNMTALHELTHSTGHENRLKRDIRNSFGSEEYAKEELVAELGSCFASELLDTPMSDREFNNATAYVDSWISIIKDKPNELAKAITKADKAADYMIDCLKD